MDAGSAPDATRNPWPARALALAAGLVLAASFVLPDGVDDGEASVRLCLFRSATGLPCPGCGLTRGFSSLSRGKFAQAWAFNPFAGPLYAVTVAAVFAPLLWTRLPPGWENRPAVRWGILLFLLLMLAYGLARMAGVLLHQP